MLLKTPTDPKTRTQNKECFPVLPCYVVMMFKMHLIWPWKAFFPSTIQGRRRTGSLERGTTMALSATSKLNHLYGVKAWRSWVQQRNKQPQKCEFFSWFLINFLFNLHCLRFTFILPVTADPVQVKEDVLDCNSAELSFGLSCFIKEVRRPNGAPYSPDSIFYLCLGIQQVPTKNCTTGFHHVSLFFS